MSYFKWYKISDFFQDTLHVGKKYDDYPSCLSKNGYFWRVDCNTYQTISAPVESKLVERKSTFLAFALPVASEDEVDRLLRRFRKDYYDARHVCYAYRLGCNADERSKSSDNGEPSGTAGRPMLGCLLSHNLTDVLVVAVRYFGGIKLGVPGLIAAYKTATEEVIQKATVITRAIEHRVTLTFGYERMNDVMQLLKRFNIKILENLADTSCRLVVSIPHEHFGTLTQQLVKVASVQSTHVQP